MLQYRGVINTSSHQYSQVLKCLVQILHQYVLIELCAHQILVLCYMYLLSSLVPSVGRSGSSNDLSSDSRRASLISDLKQKCVQSGNILEFLV